MTIIEQLKNFIGIPQVRVEEHNGWQLQNNAQNNFIQNDLFLPLPNAQPHQPIEKPEPPMVADAINKINHIPPRLYPASTSSLPQEYYDHWCGSTVHSFSDVVEKIKDPLKLNEVPLKQILVKIYPWVLDVTEVRVKPKSNIGLHLEGAIYTGPLEIHITVSPTHHTELMNPKIENKVREKLYENLLPLITCIYEYNNKHKPQIVFSPEHSETILELIN